MKPVADVEITYPTTDVALPERGQVRLATYAEMPKVVPLGSYFRRWVVFHDGTMAPAVRTEHGANPGDWRLEELCPFGCKVHHLHGEGAGHRSHHCSDAKRHPWTSMGYYLLPPAWNGSVQ